MLDTISTVLLPFGPGNPTHLNHIFKIYTIFCGQYFNCCGPKEVIWWHTSESTLHELMFFESTLLELMFFYHCHQWSFVAFTLGQLLVKNSKRLSSICVRNLCYKDCSCVSQGTKCRVEEINYHSSIKPNTLSSILICDQLLRWL